MSNIPAENERYTIRRQFFRLFGAAFHIYDKGGNVVGYCKQAALRLKEDLRIYTDESMSKELLRICARSVIDWGATYDIFTPVGERIGAARRKGWTSTFVRDSWQVLNGDGQQIATLEETGPLAFLRHWVEIVAFLSPQQYELKHLDGRRAARFRQHFSIFIFRLGVSLESDDDEHFDDLVVLALGCILAAIEGRQRG